METFKRRKGLFDDDDEEEDQNNGNNQCIGDIYIEYVPGGSTTTASTVTAKIDTPVVTQDVDLTANA